MNEMLILITNKAELKNTLRELLSEKDFVGKEPEFEKERINRTKAEKLANVSPPTFKKMIDKGIVKEHGFGRKKFFLKSELIEALKRVADQKQYP